MALTCDRMIPDARHEKVTHTLERTAHRARRLETANEGRPNALVSLQFCTHPSEPSDGRRRDSAAWAAFGFVALRFDGVPSSVRQGAHSANPGLVSLTLVFPEPGRELDRDSLGSGLVRVVGWTIKTSSSSSGVLTSERGAVLS